MRLRPIQIHPRLSLSLLLAACLMVPGCSGGSGGEGTETVVAEIRAVPIRAETVTPKVRAVGTLEPFPGLAVEILPSFPGRILEIRVHEGERVAKGQVLVRMDTSSRARAEHAQAKRTLAAAELQASRAKRLYEAGAWSKAAWEEADRTLGNARSQEEATAADARREAESAELKAPLSGVAANLAAVVGAQAEGSAPLLKIVDSSTLLARLQVPAQEAEGLGPGAKVSFTVPARPSLSPQETTVWKRALPLEPSNQSVQVQLRVENVRGLLAPGMAVEASIALAPRQGLVVPAEAVVTRNAATVIFRVARGKAEQVAVKAVEIEGGRQEVRGEGFKAGDPVATSGAYELSDGMAVKVVP